MIARAAMGSLPEADVPECLSRFLGDHGCTGTDRIESGKVGLARPFCFEQRAVPSLYRSKFASAAMMCAHDRMPL